MIDVAVIIVNYASADLAIAAVESVRAHSHGGRGVEIHLVDNASPGDDAARLAAAVATWGPEVVFYPEGDNHGFGRGNNLVLERLAARPVPPAKVFLLNPDAALSNEAIAHLADFLDANPRAGAVGARIEQPGQIPVSAAFRFPGVISEFSAALAFGPVSRLCARWEVPLAPDLGTGPVDWVAGAAVMFRLEALEDVGFFDPDFFLYYEEVELMHRLQRAGWACWHVAEAEVVHIEGAATGLGGGRAERRRRPAYWYHSWATYFHKTHGRAYAIAAYGAWMLGAAMNFALSGLRGKSPHAPLGLFGDAWSVAARPLLGLGARPYD